VAEAERNERNWEGTWKRLRDGAQAAGSCLINIERKENREKAPSKRLV
jgi:hypothetical protein